MDRCGRLECSRWRLPSWNWQFRKKCAETQRFERVFRIAPLFLSNPSDLWQIGTVIDNEKPDFRPLLSRRRDPRPKYLRKFVNLCVVRGDGRSRKSALSEVEENLQFGDLTSTTTLAPATAPCASADSRRSLRAALAQQSFRRLRRPPDPDRSPSPRS